MRRTTKKPKRRSAIVPAAVFAVVVSGGVIPSLAGCGDDSGPQLSVAQNCFATNTCVADAFALGVANIGFDMMGVADIAFHD